MSADEIIGQYIEVIGGADTWKALKNSRAEGKMAMMGQEFPFTATTGAPDRMRLDVDVMGQQMVMSYDGETAWQIMPMMGINKPTKMGEAEAKQVNQSELVPEFIDYAERGYKVELVDAREIEGVQTQGIRITDGKDKDQTYYFDLENYVPIMVESVAKEGPMKGAVLETYFSDYQELDNGIIMPFYTEVKTPMGSQKMTFTKVETDVELKEDFFSMPE